MNDYLKIFSSEVLPSLFGILAAWLVAWAAQKGIALDRTELVALFGAVWAIVQRLITTPKKVRRLRAARRGEPIQIKDF